MGTVKKLDTFVPQELVEQYQVRHIQTCITLQKVRLALNFCIGILRLNPTENGCCMRATNELDKE